MLVRVKMGEGGDAQAVAIPVCTMIPRSGKGCSSSERAAIEDSMVSSAAPTAEQARSNRKKSIFSLVALYVWNF